MRLMPRGSAQERWVVAAGGLLLSWVLRIIGMTSRSTFLGAEELRGCFERKEQVILAFWHGRMVMMPFGYLGQRACIMNSRHRDGALISRAIERFGIEVVHGSSSRGWVGGLKGLLNAAEAGLDLAVVPDGPRGPRCHAKSGVVQLARSTGLPIYPVSNSADPRITLHKSWDWLSIPWPLARVVFAVGEPLRIPRDATAEDLEAARKELQSRLNRATEQADAALAIPESFTREYLHGAPARRQAGRRS